MRSPAFDVDDWAAELPEVTFQDGEQIFVDGQRHNQLLILLEGAVQISKSGVQIAVIDQPGTFLGEMAVLLGSPATATVTALGECRFRRSDDPLGLMRTKPDVAISIAMTVARRLDLVTGYLADLRSQYSDRSDHLGVVAEVLETLIQHNADAVEPGSDREPDPPY
jgi:CRP/FNR family cyclic AMP-dependent transcriptional regulator